jgi:hypothetical protein
VINEVTLQDEWESGVIIVEERRGGAKEPVSAVTKNRRKREILACAMSLSARWTTGYDFSQNQCWEESVGHSRGGPLLLLPVGVVTTTSSSFLIRR